MKQRKPDGPGQMCCRHYKNTDANKDICSQQTFQSPSMQEKRYSMRKSGFKKHIATIPALKKVLEEKPQTKKANFKHKNRLQRHCIQ